MAPAEAKIWSAGSHPTSVKREAIAVLEEIGIDISGHRSKSVAEIPASEIDTVITLCAEEVCPVFLGNAQRLHWGLPDPVAAAGPYPDALNGYRKVRDELSHRIADLLQENS